MKGLFFILFLLLTSSRIKVFSEKRTKNGNKMENVILMPQKSWNKGNCVEKGVSEKPNNLHYDEVFYFGNHEFSRQTPTGLFSI